MISVRCLLAAFLALGSTQALAGATYKWVDSEGKVHYTDAPPAQGKVLNRSELPSASSGDANYCDGLQRAAQVLAAAMRRGAPAEEASTALRSAEVATGQVLKIDPAVQQQVIGYIYSFKHSHGSASVIAGNVRSRCLNGIYAAPKAPKTEPKEEAP